MAQIGSAEDEEKPRFAQLNKEHSLETITLEEALELFKFPRALGDIDGKPVTVGKVSSDRISVTKILMYLSRRQ